MEKIRLKARAYAVCKWYAIIGSVLFVVWDALVWILYVSDENIGEYCIHAAKGERYDFRVNENSACLIDWMYFIREPLFMSALVFTVLFLPAFLAMHILKTNKE